MAAPSVAISLLPLPFSPAPKQASLATVRRAIDYLGKHSSGAAILGSEEHHHDAPGSNGNDRCSPLLLLARFLLLIRGGFSSSDCESEVVPLVM